MSVILAFMMALSVGCASQNAAVSSSNESRQIVDIVLDENPDSLILGIRGNQNLTHKENRQVDPKKIVLFFPDTSLNGFKGRFFPPDNEFIRTIMTSEQVENETTNSTIYITLKSVSPYTVTSDSETLQVTFPKISTYPEKIMPQQKPAENKPEPQPAKLIQKSEPVATVLRTVTTETLADTATVNVKANGAIKNYKAFTLVNPDRIVFDIYKIKSPHQNEQKIAVQSKWIKRIRYFGHPNKLRLVIEALNISDSKYSSVSTDSGLLISVGAK
ncbi:MAG: AMIN domain-containing protein [bacterium]|nr:AMIN domain-containing protein [bacterium]